MAIRVKLLKVEKHKQTNEQTKTNPDNKIEKFDGKFKAISVCCNTLFPIEYRVVFIRIHTLCTPYRVYGDSVVQCC